ncbi:MAG: hypothetical protein QM691_10915 [Opitutaceae bacterium]
MYWIISGVLVVAGVLLYLFSPSDVQRGEQKNLAVAAPSAPAHAAAPKPLARVEETGPIYTEDALASRFGLTGIEAEHSKTRVRELMCQWKEAKGAMARVLSVNGDELRMFIPALAMSAEQIRQSVQQALAVEIGPERARRICEDKEGWAALVRWSGFDQLLMDQDCTITRTKAEGRLSQAEYALFTVVFDQKDVSNHVLPGNRTESQIFEGYDYRGLAASEVFSWAAVMKAPQGYFCSEPITEAPKPKPCVTVEHELDTGNVTVHNLRFDGSVERFNINDPVPASP